MNKRWYVLMHYNLVWVAGVNRWNGERWNWYPTEMNQTQKLPYLVHVLEEERKTVCVCVVHSWTLVIFIHQNSEQNQHSFVKKKMIKFPTDKKGTHGDIIQTYRTCSHQKKRRRKSGRYAPNKYNAKLLMHCALLWDRRPNGNVSFEYTFFSNNFAQSFSLTQVIKREQKRGIWTFACTIRCVVHEVF